MITLEISTHSSSEVDIIEVEEYDVEDVANKINDESIQAIVFGNNIYSRIDLKNIKVINESEREVED